MFTRINKILVLFLGVYILAFMQSHWSGPRLWLGFQPDLSPALLVFVGLTMGAGYVSTLAIFTGLLLDSLSANPLGVSVLPLFFAGWVVFCFREKVMVRELFAQVYLGIMAGLIVFLFQLILLILVQANPMFGWGMGFWALLNSLFCGAAVPLFNLLSKTFEQWFSHPSYNPNRWPNSNRQIVRGKD